MKKILILSSIIIVLLFISSCKEVPISEGISQGVSKGIDWLSCKNPYKYIGGNCCIDSNNNGVCEADEPTPTTCKDECNFEGKQCHNGNVNSCVDKNGDGCKEFKLEQTCADDERCYRGQCEKNIQCGDGYCDAGKEDCDICPKDCLPKGQKCCVGNALIGECCIDSECGEHKKCEGYKCIEVEYCGNKKCDINTENCEECPQDCSVASEQKCCNKIIVQGNCCNNNDCKPNMKCDNYTCVQLPIQEPANNITQPTNETTNQTTNVSNS